MRNIIVATGNNGKLKEFAELLADFPVRLTSLRDHFKTLPIIPETGATFEENSRIKAEYVYKQSHEWVLADDSGLEVDALNGAPGVLSARYAGEGATDRANVIKLLDALKGVAPAGRTARFMCVITLMTSAADVHIARGVCEGQIAFDSNGQNGFGYDPVFIPRGFSSTFAQLDQSIKHMISHRGKALMNLRKELLSTPSLQDRSHV
jgi:XTP/dITP diphosphohydrolase